MQDLTPGAVRGESLPSLAPGAGPVKDPGDPHGLRPPALRDKVAVTHNPIFRKEPYRAA